MERRETKLTPALPSIRDDASRRKVAKQFRDNYRRYQYCIVEYLCTHLTDCAVAFGGDLHKVLILALIGQVQLRSVLSNPERLHATSVASAISASRLADVSSIPRQTVRRKLAELAAAGYVEPCEAGWRLKLQDGQSVARKQLAALDEKGIQNASALFLGLEAIIRSA